MPSVWINPILRQQVFHEIAGAQVQHVEFRDAIEFLLEKVQADDRPDFVGPICADAAQTYGVGNTGFLRRAGQRVAHAVLITADVFDSHVWRDQGVDRAGADECSRHCGCIRHITDKRLGTLLDKRLQAIRAAPDHPNLLSLGQ